MAKKSDNGGKRKAPEHFIEIFEERDNDFAISITKVFPPEVKSAWAKKAYLIKLRLVLNMPADDWKYFTALTDTLRKAKMFCGIWTPAMGDVVIDDYGCYTEMTAYLRAGTEDRLVHLDRVIRASPKLGTGAQLAGQTDNDVKFVETFVDRVKAGDMLEDAMERTKEVVPIPSKQPVEDLVTPKYVIGKSIVVQGGIANKLAEAEKKVEEELEDEDD